MTPARTSARRTAFSTLDAHWAAMVVACLDPGDPLRDEFRAEAVAKAREEATKR